jgi:hypothetical protein
MSKDSKAIHLQGLQVELQNKFSSYLLIQEEEEPDSNVKVHRQPRRILSNQEILEELAKQKVIQQNLLEVGKNGRLEETYIMPQNISKSPQQNRPPRKGFGCSANRFPENKNDVLSPVAYLSPEHKSIQNFNQKGCGNGFVSKSLRFSHGLYSNFGPGPGSYFDIVGTELMKNNSVGVESPHSYHHPKAKKRPIIRPLHKKDNFPGPGEYHPKEDLITKSSPNYHSVFHSSSVRNILPKTIDNDSLNLSPEQYQVARSLEYKVAPKKNESSFFANPVIVNKPNPFYEPLINQVVHKTNADITNLYSEFRTKPQEKFKDKLHIEPTSHLSLAKKPIVDSEKSLEKAKDLSKDQIFGSKLKIPRIHSLEINV